MRTWSLLGLVFLASCGAVGTAPTVVLSEFDVNPAGGRSAQPQSSEVLGNVSFGILLNDERGQMNVLPVVENALLNEAAAGHAQDMVENDYVSHTGLDGSTAADRVLEVGYDYTFVAENIAQGFDTQTEVMDAWMDSPGHAANILDPRAVDFGLAQEDDTWVLLLGAQ